MVIKQSDIEMIEALQTSTNKVDLITLQEIYNKYTGLKKKDCFCSIVRRKVWMKHFLEWYHNNK
jgi:hypothetical protein